MKDFAAIDFETANECRSSVCSVGVVIVKDGNIVDKYYSLIHPEPDYYQWFCQEVHGLSEEDTDSAPAFPYVWEKMGLNQKYRAMPKPLVDGPTEGEPVQDRGVIIDGVSFFGLAYGHSESLIPEGTDILITHNPPLAILDDIDDNSRGSLPLLRRVCEVKPRLHLFGQFLNIMRFLNLQLHPHPLGLLRPSLTLPNQEYRPS